MQLLKLPKFMSGPMETAIALATGGVPATQEDGPAKRPYDRAKEITQKASAKAAALSGSLSIPVGPLGMLTILPDLMFVWRIQAQMVVDIAAAFGHTKPLSQEELMACLFKHVAETANREYEKSIPLDHEDKPKSLLLDIVDQVVRMDTRDVAVRVGKQVGQVVAQNLVKRAASRFIPLAGAAVVATYAAMDTKEVARTAVEKFSGEKLPARHNKKNFPRPEEMFEVQNIKDLEP